jgi:bifunctional non-homologous end joining protein LigD
MSDDRSRLPQRATFADAVVQGVDWLFEPCWMGDRLMARVERGRVSLTDRQGRAADEAFAEAAEVLGPAVDAEGALIDGIWTSQPFVGEGSPARHLAEAIAEEGLADELPDPIESETRWAFVALDLVELDGQPLHDIPYLERRRLLDSVIDANIRVRVSPAVRLPINIWIDAWRSNGFDHYVAKHVNSRYRPGEVAADWLRIPIEPDGGQGGLFGRRRRRSGRVIDLDHDDLLAGDEDRRA